MKSIIIKSSLLFVFILSSYLLFSCRKAVSTTHEYLNLSHGVVNIGNTGSATKFSVSANIAWKLSVESGGSDWFTMDKTAGEKDQSVIISATMDCLPRGGVRKATIIANAPGYPAVPAVKLMLLQQDTTFKR